MNLTKAEKKLLKVLARANYYNIDVYTNHLTRAAKELGCEVSELLLYTEYGTLPFRIDKSDFLEFFYWYLNWADMPYDWKVKSVYERLGGIRK